MTLLCVVHMLKVPMSLLSRFEPCCIPITCKKNRSCQLCYHSGPCKCICTRGFSARGIDTDITACHSCGPWVCVCLGKGVGDDELFIPCGDNDDSDIENGATEPLLDGSKYIFSSQSSVKFILMMTSLGLHAERSDIQGQGGVGHQEQIAHGQIQKHHLEYAWLVLHFNSITNSLM